MPIENVTKKKFLSRKKNFDERIKKSLVKITKKTFCQKENYFNAFGHSKGKKIKKKDFLKERKNQIPSVDYFLCDNFVALIENHITIGS